MGVRLSPGSSWRVTGSEQLRRRWLQIASRSYTCTRAKLNERTEAPWGCAD